jgi:hypothetical protein
MERGARFARNIPINSERSTLVNETDETIDQNDPKEIPSQN